MPSVYLENQEITKELKRQKHELELKIKSLNKIRCDFYKKKFCDITWSEIHEIS